MLKSLIFLIVPFCALSASPRNLTTAKGGTYNLQNAENETEENYFCDDKYCNNRGICWNFSGTPICDCYSEYIGDRCEIVQCDDEYCNYNGTCWNFPDGPKCYCRSKYFGRRCEIGDCESNPCNNKGWCLVEEGKETCECRDGETCECRDGYYGDYCEENPCKPNPCQNGGICRSSARNTFRCVCRHNHTGDKCEVGYKYTYKPGVIQILVYVAIVLIGVLISCGIILCYQPRKNNTTFTASQTAVIASPVHQSTVF